MGRAVAAQPDPRFVCFRRVHYAIRTVFEGHTYEMGDVPRLYVPGYLLIRVPLITLAGAALAVISTLALPLAWTQRRRDLALVLAAAILPLACQVALHGPAFTGMRHFLFVLPVLATLAGIGFDAVLDRLAAHGRLLAAGAAAAICACFVWDGATLARLHPYENLSYNSLVGGLPGAYRRYDMDYWFNSMPEAIHRLEAYLREKTPLETSQAPKIYSVAVCGIQLSFDRTVSLPQLRWDFRSEWDESEFFISADAHELRQGSRRRHRRHRRAVRRADRLCEGPPQDREAADGDRGLAVVRTGQSQGKLMANSNIRAPFQRVLLRMLESKSPLRNIHSSGALDLTFALRARG